MFLPIQLLNCLDDLGFDINRQQKIEQLVNARTLKVTPLLYAFHKKRYDVAKMILQNLSSFSPALDINTTDLVLDINTTDFSNEWTPHQVRYVKNKKNENNQF